MRNPLFLCGSEPVDLSEAALSRVASHKAFDQRMQRAVARGQPLAQKSCGKLDGHEAMPLVGIAQAFQCLFSGQIKPGRQRVECNAAFLTANRAMSRQIQAK